MRLGSLSFIERYVPRSARVYAPFSFEESSVSPMPWPSALYQAMSLVGVMPAEVQMLNSLVFVPLLSPRLAKEPGRP